MNMRTIRIALLAALLLCGLQQVNGQTMEKDVTIIELIQTEGSFETEELQLLPGKYQFRVVNDGVEKDLGFVIQKEEDKDKDVMETAVENSFTTAYVKKDKAEYTGVVQLESGTYVYSCPLNPTPHYRIIVR